MYVYVYVYVHVYVYGYRSVGVRVTTHPVVHVEPVPHYNARKMFSTYIPRAIFCRWHLALLWLLAPAFFL